MTKQKMWLCLSCASILLTNFKQLSIYGYGYCEGCKQIRGVALYKGEFKMVRDELVEMKMNNDLFLGKEIRDKVTGFKGICTGKAIYLYGCTQYSIIPKVIESENKVGDGQWFDEGRIEIIGKGLTKEEVITEDPGGPNRDAPKL